MIPDVALDILRALGDWQHHFDEGFHGAVLLSVEDARSCDEYSGHGKSEIKVGDTGTIWGVPCLIVDRTPGTFEFVDERISR